MIVDDHAFFRRGLREVLNDEPNMEVVAEASGGDEAIDLARRLRPLGLDLVLMDIDMAPVDGITATERLVADDPDLPVVMLTVSTLDRDLFDAVRVGAVGFLSKSLSPEALVRALRRFQQDEALPMSRSMATKVLAYFQQAMARPTPATAPDASTASGAPGAPGAPDGPTGTGDISLTPRELEVLEHIARGARDREIADALVVTESTVKKHVQNILRKLHARNRVEAVARLRGHRP
jgi:two-component system NarL family response regulator